MRLARNKSRAAANINNRCYVMWSAERRNFSLQIITQGFLSLNCLSVLSGLAGQRLWSHSSHTYAKHTHIGMMQSVELNLNVFCFASIARCNIINAYGLWYKEVTMCILYFVYCYAQVSEHIMAHTMYSQMSYDRIFLAGKRSQRRRSCCGGRIVK